MHTNTHSHSHWYVHGHTWSRINNFQRKSTSLEWSGPFLSYCSSFVIDCLHQIGHTHFDWETRIEFNRQLNKCFSLEKGRPTSGQLKYACENVQAFGHWIENYFSQSCCDLWWNFWIQNKSKAVETEEKNEPFDKSARAQNAKFSRIVNAIDKAMVLKFAADRITICSGIRSLKVSVFEETEKVP